MRKLAILCIALLLALQGCAGRLLTPMQNGVVPQRPLPPLPTAFAYPKTPVEPIVLEPPQRIGASYIRSRLAFSAGAADPDDEIGLHVHYFQGAANKPRPVVIVVPIWGNGPYRYPSRKFAQHVRDKSDGRYDVIEILGEPPLIRWQNLSEAETPAQFRQRAEAMSERIRLASISIRRMLDWAAAREQVDADSAAIVGFSVGAIVTTLVLGTDDRFAAGALAMGGARYDEIFAHCDGRAGELRQTITQRFGWSQERYRRLFADVFAVGQPRRFERRYDPRKLLMLDAAFDDCIPEGARDALWQTLGRPQRISFLARHRPAFLAFTPLSFNYGGRTIYQFFRERLEDP